MPAMPLELPALADTKFARETGVQTYFFQVPTAKRLRPRWRLRARILRPFFVDMRRRNPWVRRREVLLGWNVRFMALFP